jgi:uncharacterized protein (UPF0335 family)
MASLAKSNTPTLRSIIDRVNRLEDEKQEIAEAIKEVYAEAKSNGFNVKALRQVVRQMRKPPDAEVEALIDNYKLNLGMLADTPLGEASIKRAVADVPFLPGDDEMRPAEPATA